MIPRVHQLTRIGSRWQGITSSCIVRFDQPFASHSHYQGHCASAFCRHHFSASKHIRSGATRPVDNSVNESVEARITRLAARSFQRNDLLLRCDTNRLTWQPRRPPLSCPSILRHASFGRCTPTTATPPQPWHALRHRLASSTASTDISGTLGLEDSKPASSKKSLGLFASCVVLLLGYVGFTIRNLHEDYKVVRDYNTDFEDPSRSFKTYLYYRFALWFVWTKQSNAIILGSITGMITLASVGLYHSSVGGGILHAFQLVASWLMSPDGGVGEATRTGRAIALLVSVCGLIIFALLLTMVQDAFHAYLHGLTMGRSPVMECGHTLIIGLADHLTVPLVKELCIAHESEGGKPITVLTTKEKAEMEHLIQEGKVDYHGSRVIVRKGHPHHHNDLKHASAHNAKAIVIIPDLDQPKETRDAFVLRTIIALRGEGWPISGRIVALCSLPRNEGVFRNVGGDNIDVLMLDSFVAKLMVESSRHPGLGTLVNMFLGFEGSELYLVPVPSHLVGSPFSKAFMYYPSAIPVGVMNHNDSCAYESKRKAESCLLCPPSDRTLVASDELVLLAADSANVHAAKQPMADQMSIWGANDSGIRQGSGSKSNTGGALSLHGGRPEKVLILGWNDTSVLLILELDPILPRNSEVVVLSPKKVDERELDIANAQKRANYKLKNIRKVRHVLGQVGSRFILEELPIPVEQNSRIFILSDASAKDHTAADSCTIGMLVQVQDILAKKGCAGQILRIVPEIWDPESVRHLDTVGATNFIEVSALPSKVMAMVAYESRTMSILENIITEKGHVSFAVRKIEDYIEDTVEAPQAVSFVDVSLLARRKGEVVVGWSQANDASENNTSRKESNEKCLSWELNPEDKLKPRKWKQRDRIVVLAHV